MASILPILGLGIAVGVIGGLVLSKASTPTGPGKQIAPPPPGGKMFNVGPNTVGATLAAVGDRVTITLPADADLEADAEPDTMARVISENGPGQTAVIEFTAPGIFVMEWAVGPAGEPTPAVPGGQRETRSVQFVVGGANVQPAPGPGPVGPVVVPPEVITQARQVVAAAIIQAGAATPEQRTTLAAGLTVYATSLRTAGYADLANEVDMAAQQIRARVGAMPNERAFTAVRVTPAALPPPITARCVREYCRFFTPNLDSVYYLRQGARMRVSAASPDGRIVQADPRNPRRGLLAWAVLESGLQGWVHPDGIALE